jgi:ATP-dependent Lon protease
VNKPLLLTRGIVIFPTVEETIEIGRVRSIKAVQMASDGDKKIIVVSQRDPQIEEPTANDIYQVGSLCRITFLEKNADDSYKVTIKGEKRVLVKKVLANDVTLSADFDTLKETNLNSKEIQERLRLLYDMIDKSFTNYAKPKETKQLKVLMLGNTPPNKIADQVAAALPVDQDTRQKLLEELDVLKRIDHIIRLSAKEEDTKAIDNEINRKVNSTLSRQQKEFYLREKMRVVKEELGEINSRENDVNAFKKRVEENPYPEHIKKRVLSELSRMESSNPQENSVTRGYIEWLLDIP